MSPESMHGRKLREFAARVRAAQRIERAAQRRERLRLIRERGRRGKC